jgi:hypothetical protein
MLFNGGVHPVTGIKSNMKNRPMPLYNSIMLLKRCVIETVNEQLKNICYVEHPPHRSVHNFIMNLIAALGAYSLFDKRPAIKVEWQHSSGQLELFY